MKENSEIKSPVVPIVSVCMIAFNHEKFISEAIESVLMQKCNFDYELVIGDDSSTDETRNIIIDYAKRFPEKIKPLINKKNLGMAVNLKQTFNSCNGKYIAMLEGDDYWIDPLKLQKQVDYLDNNPGLSAACHNVKSLFASGETSIRFSDRLRPKEIISLNDMLKSNWASTPTVVIKSEVIKTLPDFVFKERVIDYFLWCYAATIGDIGYIHETMAVYRVHNQGVWSKNTLKDRVFFETGNKRKATEMFCLDKKVRDQTLEELNRSLIRNLKEEGLRYDAFLTCMKLGLNLLFQGQFSKARHMFSLAM